MSYQALARKWRPRQFAELVAQEPVVRTLSTALDNDRLHHAFLFTGTRGVGKTTVARILAKAVNCEQGVSATPCGKCGICRSVDEGRLVDLIEVDAASRTKVEDTRELLDNVQYAPTHARYKVYLIDEVHMLSGHSFNALLKTLEEPPPHVIFLLATTDPKKVPLTVLSRCLQFNLKPIPPEQIVAQLENILKEEQVDYDAPSLALLARSARGSMRDALSLLDQAIAHGGGDIEEAAVRGMLGSVDQDHIQKLLAGLGESDAGKLLGVVEAMAQRTPEYEAALDELLMALHDIGLAHVAPQVLEGRDSAISAEQAAAISHEDVQLYYQIGLLAKRDLPLAPDPRSGFEMALLRMLAFRPAGTNVRTATTPAGEVESPVQASDAAPAAQLRPAGPWADIVAALPVNGLLKELVSHTLLEERKGGRISLLLDESRTQLLNPSRQKALEKILSEHLGEQIKLRIRAGKPVKETPALTRDRLREEKQAAAVAAIDSDPNVQGFIETFGASVDPASVRPKHE